MDYIAGHYADENISIATIAEHLCVSEDISPMCLKANRYDRNELPDQDAH